MNTKKLNTEKENPTKKKGAIFKKIAVVVFGFLILLNTYQLLSYRGIIEQADHYNKSLIDEVGGIKEDLTTFEEDMNEMRKFLLLPEKNYAFSTIDATETETGNVDVDTGTKTAVYTFITSLADEEKTEKNAKIAEENLGIITKDKAFLENLGTNGLKINPIENNETAVGFKITENTIPLFSFFIDKKTNTAKIQSILETYQIKESLPAAIIEEILTYTKDKKIEVSKVKISTENQKKALRTLINEVSVKEVLKGKKLTFTSDPKETEAEIVYAFQNNDGKDVLQIAILKKNAQFKMEDKFFDTWEELSKMFVEKIETLDTSSIEEKTLKDRREKLEAIFQEDAFKDLLKNNSLTLHPTPREEPNRVVYDIKKQDGSIAFSFIIEISSGNYKILKNNEERDLFSAMDESGSKKKT